MSLLREVVGNLIGMFLADARLSLSLLAVVAGSAAAMRVVSHASLVGGAALTSGTLLVLLVSVWRAAQRERSSRAHSA